jgi:hypothetical protein
MSGAAAVESRHNTPTASEDDEKVLTAQDEMTTAGAPTTEYSRRSWQCNMLLNGKSLYSVHSYSDWLILHRQVLDRFGEIHSWILYWNNWTLSATPNQERARTDLWLKYYDPMDRILLEQEYAEVLEETFKDFPLAHVSFHNLDRDKTGSVTKLCQELLTEFPIDKKCATFEFLARVIQFLNQRVDSTLFVKHLSKPWFPLQVPVPLTKRVDSTLFVNHLSKPWFPLQVPVPLLFSPLLPHD